MSGDELLRDAMPWVEDFPRPDWRAVSSRLDEATMSVEQRESALAVAERCWLRAVAKTLGGGYRVDESAAFLLLNDTSLGDAADLLTFADGAVAQIVDALERLAPPPRRGGRKIPVLRFSEEDDYYAYVAHFDLDGHYGLSGGVFVPDAPSGHIAINVSGPIGPEDDRAAVVRRTLVHELVHAHVAHLPLPMWLNEGMTEIITRLVVREPPLAVNQWGRAAHRRYWESVGLEPFWGGGVFSWPDEGQHLSYELAEGMVRRLHEIAGARFDDFVLAVRREDSGESAALALLQMSLSQVARDVLGPGPWLPPYGSGKTF